MTILTSSLTAIGWTVVHSLWLGTLLAGFTALVLSLMRETGSQARGVVAGAGLALMLVAPVLATVTGVDPLTPAVRMPMTRVIDAAIDLSNVLTWRSVAVRGAALAWLAGIAVAAIRIGAEWRRAQALRRDALNDAGDAVREVIAELRARLAVDTPVDVRGSTHASVPMVLGWRRPIVLLPVQAVRALRADQLRAVLAHELAHIRRRDYLANLWQLGIETVLFHHPGAWWLSKQIRTEREYCCDDVAVAVGGDAGGYARALAELEDARGECRLAVAAASGTLLDRIRRIVGEPRPILTPARAAGVFALASIVAGILFACTVIVPPSVPLDAQMRRRSPAPPGALNAAPPAGQQLPRKTQR